MQIKAMDFDPAIHVSRVFAAPLFLFLYETYHIKNGSPQIHFTQSICRITDPRFQTRGRYLLRPKSGLYIPAVVTLFTVCESRGRDYGD